MSTFSHAGTSRLNGQVKVRFANDALRVKVLEKNGHTEVDLIELPNGPMTKEDAIAYLAQIEFYKSDSGEVNLEVKAAIEDAADRRSDTPTAGNRDKPKKEAKKPKQPAKPTMEAIEAKVAAKKSAPKTTLTKAEIQAQLADMEEAPF
jgi:hypothetical protein